MRGEDSRDGVCRHQSVPQVLAPVEGTLVGTGISRRDTALDFRDYRPACERGQAENLRRRQYMNIPIQLRRSNRALTEDRTMRSSGMVIQPSLPICQTDLPLDWYQEE